MSHIEFKGLEIHYEHRGDRGTPLVVFINGLSQRSQHWNAYVDYMLKKGYQSLSFDLLGQGDSSKPVLGYDFNENQEVLAKLLDHIHEEKVYVMGISFGGIIALKFAIEYPERCKGIVPTSAFSEIDTKLFLEGLNLYKGMVLQGFDFLLDMLMAINFSSEFLKKNEKLLPVLRRTSMAYNDYYAIQNLIESLQSFTSFTADLRKIQCPTLALNGEWDHLTPAWCHDVIRQNIKNSRLMFVQHGYHAFTLEFPDITCRIIADFVDQGESGRWKGDQTVWIADDDINSEEIAFSYGPFDHLRRLAIPMEKSRKSVLKRYEKYEIPDCPDQKYSGRS